ncbi:hypothetical protein [Frankia sp. CcWB3]
MPSEDKISRLRQLIRRVENDLSTLDADDRAQIEEAIYNERPRKHRDACRGYWTGCTVWKSMPTCTVAAAFDDPLLRSLDAIHLATALRLSDENDTRLEAFVTYDKRLLEAARRADLPTASPGPHSAAGR